MPSPYELATSMLGSSEHANHSALTTYLRNGGVNLDPQKKAWCAAFVNASLGQAGIKGTGSDMARSFLNWGKPTDTPNVGDVAVFSRGDPKGPLGHVGFYKGRDEQGNIKILAGNQSDAVSEGVMPANRLLGFRTAALPTDANGNPIASAPAPGVTLNTPPAMAPVADTGVMPMAPAPVTAQTPMAQPDMMAKFNAALMGQDGKAGPSSGAAGLDQIAAGLKPRVDPQAAAAAMALTPVSSSVGGGGGGSAQAQALLSAIMQNRRKPMGLSLMGGGLA